MAAASCTPVVLLICFRHLCGLVKADPVPPEDCRITTSGNQAFATCKFPENLQKTKQNFHLMFINSTSKTRSSRLQPAEELAYACFWRSGNLSCKGMDGYCLNSTANTDTVVIEVPFSTVTNLEYFCHFANLTNSKKLCALTTTEAPRNAPSTSGGVRNEGPSSAHNPTQTVLIALLSVVASLGLVGLLILVIVIKRNSRSQRGERGMGAQERTTENTCAMFTCSIFGNVTGNTNSRAGLWQLVSNRQQPGCSHPPPTDSLTDVNGPGPRTVVVETISRSETEKRLLSPNQRDGAFLFRTTMQKTTLALAVRRSSTHVTYHQIFVKESDYYEIEFDGKMCSFNSLATLKKYFTTSDGLFDMDRFKLPPDHGIVILPSIAL